jgi:ABC-type transport system involved in multi-copper enzyme maturation permease subunit
MAPRAPARLSKHKAGGWEHVMLGPVFEFEWKRAARRWQMYAGRGLVGLAVLIGVYAVWRWQVGSVGTITGAQAALVAESCIYALITVQLAVVLVVSPVATASAISDEKLRGRLVPLFVADLQPREIVLGKIAARTVPLLGFILCPAPLALMAVALGAANWSAILGAYVVLLAFAILGATLAFTLSVFSSRTHEVVLICYFVWCVLLGIRPIWNYLVHYWGARYPPAWVKLVNPHDLSLLSYATMKTEWSSLGAQILALVVCALVSALLIMLSIRHIQSVAISHEGRKGMSRRLHFGDRLVGLLKHVPSPSLDRYPLLWREWKRFRPSRFTLAVTGIYFGVSIMVTVAVIQMGLWNRWTHIPHLINDVQVGFGLLLVSAASVTLLSDERLDPQKLDLLLVSPLSTQAIIESKWWAAFRLLPLLVLMPVAMGAVRAHNGDGGWWGLLLIAGLVFVQGAFVTTVGLALSVWISSQRKAMVVSIIIYLAIALPGVLALGVPSPQMTPALAGIAAGSPFWAAGYPIGEYIDVWFFHLRAQNCVIWSTLWIIVYALASIILLVVVLATSDRCLGRAEDTRAPFHFFPSRRGKAATWTELEHSQSPAGVS